MRHQQGIQVVAMTAREGRFMVTTKTHAAEKKIPWIVDTMMSRSIPRKQMATQCSDAMDTLLLSTTSTRDDSSLINMLAVVGYHGNGRYFSLATMVTGDKSLRIRSRIVLDAITQSMSTPPKRMVEILHLTWTQSTFIALQNITEFGLHRYSPITYDDDDAHVARILAYLVDTDDDNGSLEKPPPWPWYIVTNDITDVREFNPCTELRATTRTYGIGKPIAQRVARQNELLHGVFTPKKCATPGSFLTCKQLGWDDTIQGIIRFSSAINVCAASSVIPMVARQRLTAVGLPISLAVQCSGPSTFTKAKQFCRDAGARLCTFAELTTHDVALDTGCTYDKQRVWTLTSCPLSLGAGEGRITVPGASMANRRRFPTECVATRPRLRDDDPDLLPVARCCADSLPATCISDGGGVTLPRGAAVTDSATVFGLIGAKCNNVMDEYSMAAARYISSAKTNSTNSDAFKSLKSCDELRFASIGKSCIQYRFQFKIDKKWRCRQISPFSSAAKFCARLGARLCQIKEVPKILTKSNMCTATKNEQGGKVDGIWTGTPCRGRDGGVSFYKVLLSGTSTCSSSIDSSVMGFTVCCGDEIPKECSQDL